MPENLYKNHALALPYKSHPPLLAMKTTIGLFLWSLKSHVLLLQMHSHPPSPNDSS